MQPNKLGGKTFEGPEEVLPLQWAADWGLGYPGFWEDAAIINVRLAEAGNEVILLNEYETEGAFNLLKDYASSALPHSPLSLSREKRQKRKDTKIHHKAARQVLKRGLELDV